MSTQAMAAYFCVGPPNIGPYYCVGEPWQPAPFWPTPVPLIPSQPVHAPCGCPPFTPEAMPADMARKLVAALERNAELLKENAELRAELEAIRRAVNGRAEP